ncbi:MAG: hypothetical protein ABR552_00315 [Actinomycetota bacterium]
MSEQRLDCNWCGSARSIEHGICQVCLMEYPLETRIIQLPVERTEKRIAEKRSKIASARIISLDEDQESLAE